NCQMERFKRMRKTTCANALTCAVRADTIRVQCIAQGYDAFQLVQISTADYRQDVELGCTHAVKRQVKGLVSVDVRKNACIHQLPQLPGRSAFREFSFEHGQADNTHHASLIGHWPCAELTAAHPFKGLADRHLRRQDLRRGTHRLNYLTLNLTPAGLRGRQVD